jgi:3',5'-cyclic AMP phosphodiesterase CpdA
LREFERAREFLAALGRPYLVIPGNHDIPAFNQFFLRVFNPFSRYRHAIRPALEDSFHARGVAVLGLNSAMAFGPWVDWSRGGLSAASLQHARDFFAATDPGDLRVLSVHHPVIGRPNGPQNRHLIEWRDILLETLHGLRVDLVLGGHYHLAYHGLVKAEAPAHHFVVAQASTACSHRRRGEANGFNVVEIDADRLRIVFHQWDGESFARWQEAEYARAQGLWQLLHG